MMASTAFHVIPEEGLLTFRRYYFVRKWGKEVIFQIFSCCFLEGNPKNLRDYLIDNGITMGRKSPFNRQEIDSLSNKPPESLDISALTKICQILWDKGVNYPGDKLKNLMRKIKDERNEVSHEEKSVSKTELNVKLQEFGKTLEEALDESEVLYPCHSVEYNQLKIEIGDSITTIQEKIREKYNPSNPEDIKKLEDEIEEFGDQLSDFIREKSVKLLKKLYEDLYKILPYGWLCQYSVVDPCTLMASLKFEVEKNGAQSSQISNTIEQTEILDKDVNGIDPEVVIISGNAGSGKTSLNCWLLEKWSKEMTHDINALSSYETLLHMEFRKQDHDNCDDYLKEVFEQLVVDFGLERVRSSILLSKCLILCDGYDKTNSSSSKLFEEILGLKCNELKIVITTQTESSKKLTCLIDKSKKHRMGLSISKLDDSERLDLVKRLTKYLIQDGSQSDEMADEICQLLQSMNNEMTQVLGNPLQLSMFVLLYIECPSQRNTLGTVSNFIQEQEKHKRKRLAQDFGIEDVEDSSFRSTSFLGALIPPRRIFNAVTHATLMILNHILTSSIESPASDIYYYFSDILRDKFQWWQQVAEEEILETKAIHNEQKTYEFELKSFHELEKACEEANIKVDSVMSKLLQLETMKNLPVSTSNQQA